MKGIGYTHPEWGHGRWKGELAVGGESWRTADLDENALENQHIQQVVRATRSDRPGEGIGVLEQSPSARTPATASRSCWIRPSGLQPLRAFFGATTHPANLAVARTRRVLLANLAICCLSGCNPEEPPTERPPAPSPQASVTLATPALLRVVEEESEQRWLARLPPEAKTWSIWTVEGTRFRALTFGGRGPAVLILPHLDGTDWIYRYLLRRFAQEDLRVLAVLPPRSALRRRPDARDLLEVLRQRVRAGRLALSLLETEGTGCTLVMGVSVGALAAVPVAAMEPSVDGLISFLGGGNLAWIGQRSDEPRIRISRKFPTESGAALPDLDPLAWAPRLGRRPVLLVAARFDRVIPPGSSTALGAALGNARSHWYPSGHYSFGIFLPAAASLAIDHVTQTCAGRLAKGRIDLERGRQSTAPRGKKMFVR